MKIKEIVGLALGVIVASQAAFGAVRFETAGYVPPHAAMASVADNPRVVETASIAGRLAGDQRVALNGVGTGQNISEPTEPDRDPSASPASHNVESAAGETVEVVVPLPSLQMSPSLVKYLGLTKQQAGAIQKLIDQARQITEPLMQKLSVNTELLAAAQSSAMDEGAARRLEAAQTRILKRIMSANSLLQQEINNLLDAQQRRKFDSLQRANELTVEEGQ